MTGLFFVDIIARVGLVSRDWTLCNDPVIAAGSFGFSDCTASPCWDKWLQNVSRRVVFATRQSRIDLCRCCASTSNHSLNHTFVPGCDTWRWSWPLKELHCGSIKVEPGHLMQCLQKLSCLVFLFNFDVEILPSSHSRSCFFHVRSLFTRV